MMKLAPALCNKLSIYGPAIFKEPDGSSLSALATWSAFVFRTRLEK
jgi:hypothetical protein